MHANILYYRSRWQIAGNEQSHCAIMFQIIGSKYNGSSYLHELCFDELNEFDRIDLESHEILISSSTNLAENPQGHGHWRLRTENYTNAQKIVLCSLHFKLKKLRFICRIVCIKCFIINTFILIILNETTSINV